MSGSRVGGKGSVGHMVLKELGQSTYFCFDWLHCSPPTSPHGISCESNVYSRHLFHLTSCCLRTKAQKAVQVQRMDLRGLTRGSSSLDFDADPENWICIKSKGVYLLKKNPENRRKCLLCHSFRTTPIRSPQNINRRNKTLECSSDYILKQTCAISQKFLDVGEAKSVRCDDLESLKKRNCPPEYIENPRGSFTVVKNKPLTNRKKDEPKKVKPEEITQIQPQKLSLTLRSGKSPAGLVLMCFSVFLSSFVRNVSCQIFFSQGEPQTFDLKFKRAEDYPIDLYYLMDLSFSMKDDLENVKNLGTALMKEMQGVTSDFRIGKDYC